MADLSLTEDQESLRDAFGKLFDQESPISRVRAAEPSGYDEQLWVTVAAAGIPLMAVGESQGGGGATLADLAVVVREAGRTLAPAPVAETAVAARLLSQFGAGQALLAEIGSGDVLPAVAVRPPAAGIARLVPSGAVADAVIVLDDGQLVLLRRRGRRPHVPVPGNLGCVPVADVVLAGGWERALLATGPAAMAAYQRARAEWQLLTAAALDGLRAEALRIGVEYVKQRHAFGVPLGWFQTIAHRLADHATAGDGSELLVHKAAWALDRARPDALALASMAFLHAAEVAFRTCRDALQFHGGYGFTVEYDIQLYFRRAKAWPLALGAPRLEYRKLAHQLFAQDGLE
jgi:alkylation response protein AidB-like acyl-CoA dehydrogenase